MQDPTATDTPATVYVVTCHRGYDGDDILAMYTGPGAEAAARRRAYDANQNTYGDESHSVTPWTGAGELTSDYRERWTAPKEPEQPKEPREYVEAKERYAKQQAEYAEARKEFA